MSYKIPLDSPLLCGNELFYLRQCVDTNWLSHQGQFVDMLCEALKKFLSVPYCVPVSSGTNAILVVLQALGVKPGDEIIVPSLTMSGCITPIHLLGAKPVWVDCADRSVNMDIDTIKEKITTRTKAILAVDLYGTPLDIQKLKKHIPDIPIIEDVAESLGAHIDGTKSGSACDIAIHSFHNKILASGEGGAITFRDSRLLEKIKDLTVPSPNNVGSKHLIMNSRMSNLSAAVAMAQFENIDYLIERRRRIADFYDNKINYNKLIQPDNQYWVYWRYQIYTDRQQQVIKSLNKKGIEARAIFSPMHKHPVCQQHLDLPNCELLSSTGIDIPISPKMTESDASVVVDAVNSA